LDTTAPDLILGIGNLLLGDEGVGVHAAHALLEEGVPPGSQVVDAGTSILDVLPLLQHARRVVVVDAMMGKGAPGTVYRVALGDCRRAPALSSMHGFDLPRVMCLVGRRRFPETVVLGVEPEWLKWSLELSPAVRAALPAVLNAVRAEIATSSESDRPAAAIGKKERISGADNQ